MTLTGLHFLLTYRCLSQCDHCFVWGSPQQHLTFTLAGVREALLQAKALGTIESVYFEGGEPALFHPLLAACVETAAALGFRVGVVTCPYWATDVEDAVLWLRPLARYLHDLTVSTDLFHFDVKISREANNALAAAEQLGIPADTIVCELPEGPGNERAQATGEPFTGGPIMFRGRAARILAPALANHPWQSLNECPHEPLEDPARVHLDPLGYLHLCQGLTMGNLFQHPLGEIVASYRPHEHPVVGPLLEGGPAGLVRAFDLQHEERYADACHLCYSAREALRPYYPELLAPGEMYGEGLEP